MSSENLKKLCICCSAFLLTASLPLCSFAKTATTDQTGPETITYTVSAQGKSSGPVTVAPGPQTTVSTVPEEIQPAAPTTVTPKSAAQTSGPATTTSTVRPKETYSATGSKSVPKQTEPQVTTSTAPAYGASQAKEKSLSIGPLTTVSTQPSAVSSQSKIAEKKATITIGHHIVIISGSLSLGYLNGVSKEYVYDPPTGHKNSELNWDTNHLMMVGLGVSVKPVSWLRLNGNVWFKANDGSGSMDDYDWELFGYSGWTEFSRSSVSVNDGLIYDLNAEFTFYRHDKTSFYGILGFRHDHWAWTATGGSYIYSTYYLHDTVGNFPNETVCTYEQTFDTPYIGLGFHADLYPFTLSGRIYGSPYVSASDKDEHVLRDLEITSSLDKGKMYGIDLSCIYNFTPNFAAAAAVQYTKFEEIKGSKYWNFYNQGEQFHYGGSMDNESTMVSLSLVFDM